MVMDRIKFPFGTEGEYYSHLMVCHDRSGYFIGRRKYNEELQREEAGTRESKETYQTQAEAAQALKDGTFTAMIDESIRELYDAGIIPMPKNLCEACGGAGKVPQMKSLGGGLVNCPKCNKEG